MMRAARKAPSVIPSSRGSTFHPHSQPDSAEVSYGLASKLCARGYYRPQDASACGRWTGWPGGYAVSAARRVSRKPLIDRVGAGNETQPTAWNISLQ